MAPAKKNTNMKNSAANKTVTNATSEVKVATPVATTIEEVASETVKETVTEKKAEKRTFSDTDKIPCISITAGELFIVGEKSKELYSWADMEDVVEVEYRDLAYMARSDNKSMYKPRFIVQDKDFLQQFPKVEAVYGSMYSVNDLKSILKMSPAQLKSEVNMLPQGAKDALKSLVATMIDNGSFDSAQRIKVLDEVFGTEMFLRMASV